MTSFGQIGEAFMSFVNSRKVSIGVVLFLLCATGAAAAQGKPSAGQNDLQKDQTTVDGQVMQNIAPSGPGAMSVRQGIQSQLQQAGYTDVSVMPSSFYVRAKDKQGHPVAMVIGPDTVTAVTELSMPSGSATAGPGMQSSGTAPAGGASTGSGSAP